MRWMGGIAGRLAIFASLVAFIATATVGYMVYRGARDTLIESAFDRVAHTAETVEVRMWATLEAIGEDVHLVAETPPVQGIVRSKLQGGLDPEWSIYDEEWGQQLAEIFRSFLATRSSYLQVRFVGVRGDDRELVRVDRRNGRAEFPATSDLQRSLTDPFIDATSRLPDGNLNYSDVAWSDGDSGVPPNTHVLHVGTPIYAGDGQVFGVIVVTVDVKHALVSFTSLVDENQSLYIANRQGDLLHASGRAVLGREDQVPDRLQDVFPTIDELMIVSEEEIQMLDVNVGRQRSGIAYLGQVPLDTSGAAPPLLVGVTEPHETILAGVRRVRNESALITLLLCIAAVVVALTASTYLTKPLRQITSAVTSFGGDGDMTTLPVERTDEIGMLARSFKAMEQQIQDQIRVLENEEQRQRTILETSAEGIIVTDAGGHIEVFNLAAEHIFGCSAESVKGKSIHSLIRGDMVGSNRILKPGDHAPGIESIGIRPDGTEILLSILWSAFEWGDETKVTIFVQDVSDRKEAEAAREQLVRQLEAERETLRELSSTLELRVRDRTADLERLNKELEVSNRELREIANVASHDLQEPLRKLRSFADLLESEYGDVLDEDGRFYAQRIFRLSERMSNLITDLLAFSRVTSKTKPYERVDLSEVAHEVVARLQGPIDESGGAVHVDSLPEVEADPVQMRELFEHLIANALTFRRPDVSPRVHISGSLQYDIMDGTDGPLCVLEFEDNGIGFDEKYAGRIFAPFERLHNRQSSERTGMGLTICRRIADHHRGTITARSTLGQGSTFVVTLPVRQHVSSS